MFTKHNLSEHRLTLFLKVMLGLREWIQDRQLYLIMLMDGVPHCNLLHFTWLILMLERANTPGACNQSYFLQMEAMCI